jgi:RNA polymerase sigma-70 factor, ECF subfamily
MMKAMTAPGKVLEPPPDGDEVRAFQAGDLEAFERLVDRYQRPVLALCQRLVGSGDAKDLFQEVFLQAYRALPQLRAPAAFRTWLYRITFRKAQRRFATRRGSGGELADPDALAAPPPPDRAELEEELARLRERLTELPPRQREVVLLRHYQGLTFAEIAETLGIREDAARANHYQGLQRLRSLLGGEGTGRT